MLFIYKAKMKALELKTKHIWGRVGLPLFGVRVSQ